MSLILSEENYENEMHRVVIPYLNNCKYEIQLEHEKGQKLSCRLYLSSHAEGIVLISHGFTENIETHLENIYYLNQAGYHVYIWDHCGHGYSYRLTQDMSLVHIDRYQRYVEDLLLVADKAHENHPKLPLYLYGHSMGGGIAAAAASEHPDMFAKLILSAPMIRPATGSAPWISAKSIAWAMCRTGKAELYVAGHYPYHGPEPFEESASASEARFQYLQNKRKENPRYQTNAASYGWLREAARLNKYLTHTAWKQIRIPTLICTADSDSFVDVKEQEQFAAKLKSHNSAPVTVKMISNSRHDIYASKNDALEIYWKQILDFLSAPMPKASR